MSSWPHTLVRISKSEASTTKMAYTSFLKISGIETAVRCWGRWVEEPDPEEVIILIPGNPGITGLYYPYLERLHRLTRKPTWIVGHGGHEEPEVINSTFSRKIDPIAGRENLFNLEGQYLQKVEFVEKYTSPSTKIHLIGHSIGAWIALEMLKNSRVRNRIKSAQLIFPTIQKIADTPYGILFNNILRPIVPIITIIFYIFNLFAPLWFCKICVKFFNYINGYNSRLDNCFVKCLYSCSSLLPKYLLMGYDEIDLIKDLDTQTIRLNADKIKIFYNENDKWAPGNFFEEIHQIIPEDRIREANYDHVFQLKYSYKMANLNVELIRSI